MEHYVLVFFMTEGELNELSLVEAIRVYRDGSGVMDPEGKTLIGTKSVLYMRMDNARPPPRLLIKNDVPVSDPTVVHEVHAIYLDGKRAYAVQKPHPGMVGSVLAP